MHRHILYNHESELPDDKSIRGKECDSQAEPHPQVREPVPAETRFGLLTDADLCQPR